MQKQFIVITQESYNIILSNQSQEQQNLFQLKVLIMQRMLLPNEILIGCVKIKQQAIYKVKVYIDIQLDYQHTQIVFKQQIPANEQNLSDLKKYYMNDSSSIEGLIHQCHKNFKQLHKTYHFKQDKIYKQELQTPYSFELGLDQDYLTKKEKINFPFLLLFEDSLMFSPLICDQDSYINNIIDNNNLNYLKEFNKNENYILLLLWKIRSTLQKMQKQSIFQFIIYPKHGNFAILKDQKLYFINQSHQIKFFRNNYQSQLPECNPIQNMIEQGKSIYVQLFDYTNSEEILDQRCKYIDLQQCQCNSLFTTMDEKKCSEYFSKLKTELLKTYESTIQVSYKQYPYIYSTQCGHQLDKNIYCPICQTQIQDYGSIFIEKPFYKYYKQMQEQIFEIGKYPPLFIDPFTIVQETDKFGNIYYLAQWKDNEQNILYQIQRTILRLNYNYDLLEDSIMPLNYDDKFNAQLQKQIDQDQDY